MDIPKSHPRYNSLRYRHMLVEGLRDGYVTDSGLIAHGRGEAFDYLLGEKSPPEAMVAEKAACAMLLLAENPVISVNGNTAALVADDVVRLASRLGAKIEVNLFYRTPEREERIERILKEKGAGEVLGVHGVMEYVPGIESARARADPGGIWIADVILIPLEDGDRAEALADFGKKTIAIDLNPLSRTSKSADIAIVDNIVRAIPNILAFAEEMVSWDRDSLMRVLKAFDNRKNLNAVASRIREGL